MAKVQVNETQFMIVIPKELQRTFKSNCAKQGLSMKEVMMEQMEEFISNNQNRDDE